MATGKATCKKCNQVLIGDYYNLPNGVYFHKLCFKCGKCYNSLINGFFRLDDKTLCEQCFRAIKGGQLPKCIKCHQPILGGKCIKLAELFFHQECFKCSSCKKTIQGTNFATECDNFYCPECNVNRKMAAMGVK